MDNFWSDFFANFLSDILAGVFLGTLLSWLIGRRLEKSEQIQRRKEEEKANLAKAMRYLELLKTEIEGLLKILPDSVDHLSEDMNLDFCVHIATPLWDILQPSGELPRSSISPDLIASLTQFYAFVTYANKAQSWVGQKWLTNETKEERELLHTYTLEALKQTLKVKITLPEKVASEIERLNKRLMVLQEKRSRWPWSKRGYNRGASIN